MADRPRMFRREVFDEETGEYMFQYASEQSLPKLAEDRADWHLDPDGGFPRVDGPQDRKRLLLEIKSRIDAASRHTNVKIRQLSKRAEERLFAYRFMANEGDVPCMEDNWHYLLDSMRTLDDWLNPKQADKTFDPTPRQRRISVNIETAVMTIDGVEFRIEGSDKKAKLMAEFLSDLIDEDGEYRNIPKGLKTPNFESQPKAIQNLIERDPGSGTRIPREKIWRS